MKQMMASKAEDPSVPMVPTPASEGVDHNGLVVGKWKSGLFSSCYKNCVPNAITPMLCPGVSMAQICARLGIANFFAVLFSYLSVDGFVFGAVVTKVDVLSTLAVIVGVLVLLFTIRIRFRMRYLFSIPGSLMEDAFSSVFCPCCTIAQMADHSESAMTNQQSTNPGTTFVYPNKLECGEGVDHNGITVGEWSMGPFNCCDDIIPNGLMSSICPVISVAQITVRLGLAGYAFILGIYVALYLLGLVAATSGDFYLLLLCVLAEFITTISIGCLRFKMRQLFSIPGNILKDAALVVLCRPCAVAQMATHVEAYRVGKCLFRARSTLPGYAHY
ncbi:hypothetical protein P3T76_010334 [Phytophthora citrophthora]|uniref:Transmembrane protein n=1 Tax=Phytophthora citrophthora TaxID=4793 RepID=A0AAD9GC54_9STRA|nr:hypothetical protein P3T76_010334 [Phytophthora citrophthora]